MFGFPGTYSLGRRVFVLDTAGAVAPIEVVGAAVVALREVVGAVSPKEVLGRVVVRCANTSTNTVPVCSLLGVATDSLTAFSADVTGLSGFSDLGVLAACWLKAVVASVLGACSRSAECCVMRWADELAERTARVSCTLGIFSALLRASTVSEAGTVSADAG